MKPSRCIILFESYVWNLSRMRGFPLPKKKKTTRDKWNESVGCNVNGNRNEIIDESMEVYNEIKKTYELGAKKQEIRTKKKKKKIKRLDEESIGDYFFLNFVLYDLFIVTEKSLLTRKWDQRNNFSFIVKRFLGGQRIFDSFYFL